jgi:hypothetical protein
MERRSQRRDIIGSGFYPDRAGGPLDGVIVLLGLHGQPRHQVQAIRVIGVRRQRPLTAELGVKMLAVPQMPVARLNQRSRGRSTGTG